MSRTKSFRTFSNGQLAVNVVQQALYVEKSLLLPNPDINELQTRLEWITVMVCELHDRLDTPATKLSA